MLGSCGMIQNVLQPQPKSIAVNGLTFNAAVAIPQGLNIDDTEVGGLSGITYNAKSKLFYALSEDPSEHSPARYYTIAIDKLEMHPIVQFRSATTLLSNTGKPYSSKSVYEQLVAKGKRPRYTTPSPKDIVYLPKEKRMVWVHQGVSDSIGGMLITQNPALNLMEMTGRTISPYQLPKPFKMEATAGPKNQKGVAAITVSPSEEKLFITTEAPLIEETADPQTYDTGYVRIYQYRNASRSAETYYAYPLDIPNDPTIAGSGKQYGVTAMTALDDSTLLILERVELPNEGYKVRLYKTVLKAEHKANPRKNLKERRYFVPLQKELIMDFNTISDLKIENIEGMTLGPKIKGKNTLVLVSNNHFDVDVQSMFYVFWIN